MSSQYGTSEVTPDIAESAEFTSPTEYTVKLKSGLKFANGHDLTSSDVKFSFDRQVAINDPNGPASLLGNLDSVAAPDDTTVVFTLKNGNDQVWPQILSSPAAPIVDEEVFSADAVTPDDTIVEGKAFAGQYMIDSYKVNELISYKVNDTYQGSLPKAANGGISAKYYADSPNLKLDVQSGAIDVAYRSLSATDVADLQKDDAVKVIDGPAARSATSSSTSTPCRTARRPPTPTGQVARDPSGRGRPRRPSGHRHRRVQRPTRPCTRTSRRVSRAPTRRSRTCTATAAACPTRPRPRRPSRPPVSRRRHAEPAVQRRPLRPLVG